MIKGLDHFALSVSDVNQLIAFYRDILGLELLRVIEARSEMDMGYIHTGFTSTDGRADYGRLRERGVSFIGEPVEFRPEVWILYFQGPDGKMCEFRQQ